MFRAYIAPLLALAAFGCASESQDEAPLLSPDSSNAAKAEGTEGVPEYLQGYAEGGKDPQTEFATSIARHPKLRGEDLAKLLRSLPVDEWFSFKRPPEGVRWEMQTTELTQFQFWRVRGQVPRGQQNNRACLGEALEVPTPPDGVAISICPNNPVTSLSEKEARGFAVALSQLSSKYNYRLPTPKEWNLVANAGPQEAWFAKNSGFKIHRVASNKPNPWGYYDMWGNVAEIVDGKCGTNMEGKYVLGGNILEESGSTPSCVIGGAGGPFTGFRLIREPKD